MVIGTQTCLDLGGRVTSVVFLAAKPRISGQNANKGFMIYCGRYRSRLENLRARGKTAVQFRKID